MLCLFVSFVYLSRWLDTANHVIQPKYCPYQEVFDLENTNNKTVYMQLQKTSQTNPIAMQNVPILIGSTLSEPNFVLEGLSDWVQAYSATCTHSG